MSAPADFDHLVITGADGALLFEWRAESRRPPKKRKPKKPPSFKRTA